MYKLIEITHLNGKVLKTILRVNDTTYIPEDEANIDYQEYLKWLAEGNTPEPADE
jgi:hypothetical protein